MFAFGTALVNRLNDKSDTVRLSSLEALKFAPDVNLRGGQDENSSRNGTENSTDLSGMFQKILLHMDDKTPAIRTAALGIALIMQSVNVSPY